MKIQTRAERAACAANDDNPHRTIVEQAAKIVAKLGGHQRGDGIQRLRPLQHQPIDGAALLDKYRFIVHGRLRHPAR
jgi:hypothetical protein